MSFSSTVARASNAALIVAALALYAMASVVSPPYVSVYVPAVAAAPRVSVCTSAVRPKVEKSGTSMATSRNVSRNVNVVADPDANVPPPTVTPSVPIPSSASSAASIVAVAASYARSVVVSSPRLSVNVPLVAAADMVKV